MFIRALAILLVLATTAEAKEQKPEVLRRVVATYPANDQGTTYEVVVEGPYDLIVRVMKGEKELSRLPVFDVSSGTIEEAKWLPRSLPPEFSSNGFVLRPYGVGDQGPTFLSFTHFPLNAHEHGLLLTSTRIVPFAWAQAIAIGWNRGAVKQLWSEKQATREQLLEPHVWQSANGPVLVLIESSTTTGGITRFNAVGREEKTGLFAPARAFYGVVLQPVPHAARDDEDFIAAVNACRSFTGHESVRVLSGPSFPELDASDKVAVALSTEEDQVKTWAKELSSCREGKEPPVVQLK